jgi:hypothetical protein
MAVDVFSPSDTSGKHSLSVTIWQMESSCVRIFPSLSTVGLISQTADCGVTRGQSLDLSIVDFQVTLLDLDLRVAVQLHFGTLTLRQVI